MLFSIMHILHILTVVAWIGGLAFITTLILPVLLKMSNPLEKVLFFQRIEHRFAPLARVYVAVVGISGFTMFFVMGLQSVLFTREGFFLLFMIAVWVFWVVMLFGVEPLVVKRMLDNLSKQKGEGLEIEDVFRRMNVMHRVLLAVSLAAAASGAIFAHGHF